MTEKKEECLRVVIDKLDVSNEDLVKTICGYLDIGVKVHVESIEKSDPLVRAKYTFIGNWKEQERPGITLSSYEERKEDCLIQIS